MEKCNKCGSTNFTIRGDMSGARFVGRIKKSPEGMLSFVPEQITGYEVGKFKHPACNDCNKPYEK